MNHRITLNLILKLGSITQKHVGKYEIDPEVFPLRSITVCICIVHASSRQSIVFLAVDLIWKTNKTLHCLCIPPFIQISACNILNKSKVKLNLQN